MQTEAAVVQIECSNPEEQAYFNLHRFRYIDTIDYLPRDKIAGATVLDVGTLPCHIPLSLRKLGAMRSIGLDHAPNRFDGQKALESKGMELFSCDVATEPFPIDSNSIDICLCNEVIEHFEQGAEYCIREITRVTKDDGLVLITTPNVENLANRIRRVFRKSLYTPERGLKGKQLHHHEYTRKELVQLLEENGLRIVQFGYIAGSEKALLAGSFPTRVPRVVAAFYAIFPILIPPLRSYLVAFAKKKPPVD